MTSVAPSAPRHELPRTSAMPIAASEMASASRNRGQMASETEKTLEVGRKAATTLMRSNPSHLARCKPWGANVQDRPQTFATVSEFRTRLVETCALDARRALDQLLTLSTPFRQANAIRQLGWSEDMARHWCYRFADRDGVLRRDGVRYEWALPLAAEQETGT